jgi:ubiquitin-conjugating enzyme E2 C
MPKLPQDILKRRIKHELELDMCIRKLDHVIGIEDPEFKEFPIKVMVTLKNTPGPIVKSNKLDHKMTHQFKMLITDEYPYEKPIVLWESLIFHPNIQLPQDGGHVCTKLLDTWNFQSNLLAFIQGIESLLANPNPKSPWGTNSCTSAAQYFNKHLYNPPVGDLRAKGPKIRELKEETPSKEEELEEMEELEEIE